MRTRFPPLTASEQKNNNNNKEKREKQKMGWEWEGLLLLGVVVGFLLAVV